jgi:acyl-coenzyme A synthetase/AMP-(fatty) acid ligase
MAAEIARLRLNVLVADPEDWARQGLAGLQASGAVTGFVADADRIVRVPGAAQVPSGSTGTGSPLAILMPTSGTTGPPKRIPITYDQLNGAFGRIADYSAATSRSMRDQPVLRSGTVIASLSVAHSAGLWAVLQAMIEGRMVALLDRFDPRAWADLVERHKVRYSALPPAAVRMVLDAGVEREQLTSLIALRCGTAPISPDLVDTVLDQYGIPVLAGYGATEFPGGVAGWSLNDFREFWPRKRGSAGRPRPGVQLRIVGEDGSVRPSGAEGLVSVRSPQAAVRGADGWSQTTDIGRLDEDGFLWITGRADDAINRGGFKIVPQVIESELLKHPSIRAAGVVGVADRRLGQIPVAAVTLRGETSEKVLLDWLRRTLPSYQVPVRVLIMDTLPTTPSMKVDKATLKVVVEGQLADSLQGVPAPASVRASGAAGSENKGA